MRGRGRVKGLGNRDESMDVGTAMSRGLWEHWMPYGSTGSGMPSHLCRQDGESGSGVEVDLHTTPKAAGSQLLFISLWK